MDKTLIVGSPNINGNVGSCEVKSDSFQKDFWHRETVAVNSCTGQIISESIYLDGSWVLFGLIVIVIILLIKDEVIY